MEKEQFLGEAIRWIKCRFIDCDAQADQEKEFSEAAEKKKQRNQEKKRQEDEE